MVKWLVVLCLLGCQQRTQLMIGVATDLRAPDALDEAQLVVTRAKDGVVAQQVSWLISGSPTEPFNLPGSYGVFSDGEELQLDLELQGIKNGSVQVRRRALLNLIEGETLFFRMTLVSGCVDRTDCDSTQSCVEGACVDRAIDSRRLPDFTESLVTELTCASGPMYLDTATGDPMPLSPTASMCPGSLCAEGTCQKPDPDMPVPPMGDGGTVVPVQPPHLYVISAQTLPQNNNEARQLGFDLNGDTTVDNQLGMVMATFSGQGFQPQAFADNAVAKGDTITLMNLAADNLASSNPATFTTFFGDNPQPLPCNGGGDLICGRHLQGTGVFGVASPPTPPLVGNITGGMLTAGPGELRLQAALLGIVPLELIGARARATSISDDMVTGVIGGAVRASEVDAILIPTWATEFDKQADLDCPGTTPPGCGCVGGSQGQSMLSLFDSAPQDCVISPEEVRNNSLIQSLIAPDLTIMGQPALSLGFGFTAVRATFQLP